MENPEGADLCFPLLFNNSCRKPTQSQFDDMLVYILLSLISLLTAALNLLIIISISHFRQLHSPTNLLILSLAVSDFLVGLLLMPLQIFSTQACWILGELMCALYRTVEFILTSSSVGNMVLISIDRYVAICNPLHYTSRVTLDRTKICICLFWICSTIYSILILKDFMRQPDSHSSCHGECIIVHKYTTACVDFVFTIFVPITVIIVLYMKIFLVAVSQAQAMRPHIAAVTLKHLAGVTAKKSEMKAARTLGIVVVVFLICLCPLYTPPSADQRTPLNSVTWLFYFNSCLNPVIYAFFYPWFRKSIKLILTFKILQSDSCDAKIL